MIIQLYIKTDDEYLGGPYNEPTISKQLNNVCVLKTTR